MLSQATHVTQVTRVSSDSFVLLLPVSLTHRCQCHWVLGIVIRISEDSVNSRNNFVKFDIPYTFGLEWS
jgi:hypothetical protein